MPERQPKGWTDSNDLAVYFETRAMKKAAEFVMREICDYPETSSLTYDFSAAAINLARYYERRAESEGDTVLLTEAEAWLLIADERMDPMNYSELNDIDDTYDGSNDS